jgi:thymidylate synthase (FAD)
MEVKLLAHTQLTGEVLRGLSPRLLNPKNTDGQMVALTAIRTCYSHLKPSEIVEVEGDKYFGRAAKDGEEGTEADRLIRHIMRSGHLSTTEHLAFTFAIEGVSRSLLAQLTRHRHFSYSVQSQRYVKLESDSKSGGFDAVVPPKTIEWKGEAEDIYLKLLQDVQDTYNRLRELGVPAEDARYILPNAATCNLVLTGNLRSILEFYNKRNPNTHAQWEIQELAEKMKEVVIEVEPWTEAFFGK